MKPVSRGAFWFSLLGGAAVIVSIIVAPGCSTWRTKRFGDASLKRVNYHFRSISIGAMPESRDFLSFPKVVLDAPSTNAFHVRNFPTNQSIYEFSLDLPRKDPPTAQELNVELPWHRARIQLIARDTNGFELFRQPIALDKLPRWRWDHYDPKPERPWWNYAWHLNGLERALRDRRDYELLIIVEEPSPERNHAVQLRGFGGGYSLAR